MEELTPTRLQSPWTSSIVIFLVALFGFIIIGPIIGMFLALPFYEGNVFTFLEDLSDPAGKENLKLPLFILQGAVTFIGLGLVPAFYWHKSKNKSIRELTQGLPVSPVSLVLVPFIVIFFMGFNSIFIYWNANVDLPDFAGGFEQWARTTEDRATVLTEFMTSFSSFGQFMIGFLVIAVLPAIGEELVFRGMLQPELQRATRNSHAGIWISAILFSALHMQFYGFIPRVLLGALFGYLFYWSGNLFIPMLAHFANNGLSVILIYFNQTTIAGMDLEKPELAPWPVVIGFSAMTFILLYYFYKIHRQPNLSAP